MELSKVFEMLASPGTHKVDLEEWKSFTQIARIVELTNVSNFTASFQSLYKLNIITYIICMCT